MIILITRYFLLPLYTKLLIGFVIYFILINNLDITYCMTNETGSIPVSSESKSTTGSTEDVISRVVDSFIGDKETIEAQARIIAAQNIQLAEAKDSARVIAEQQQKIDSLTRTLTYSRIEADRYLEWYNEADIRHKEISKAYQDRIDALNERHDTTMAQAMSTIKKYETMVERLLKK